VPLDECAAITLEVGGTPSAPPIYAFPANFGCDAGQSAQTATT
jgi:hypothetical protein